MRGVPSSEARGNPSPNPRPRQSLRGVPSSEARGNPGPRSPSVFVTPTLFPLCLFESRSFLSLRGCVFASVAIQSSVPSLSLRVPSAGQPAPRMLGWQSSPRSLPLRQSLRVPSAGRGNPVLCSLSVFASPVCGTWQSIPVSVSVRLVTVVRERRDWIASVEDSFAKTDFDVLRSCSLPRPHILHCTHVPPPNAPKNRKASLRLEITRSSALSIVFGVMVTVSIE